ncbi:MAG: chemotaxis protein chel [Paracoccus sp. (in: a-proteobacteria)]|uniref:chemotaxis protein chel n=1 Tax=Paracoccus sp. TaxID=267 RepID=UPI0026E0385E|nr:chemotaxis protein chel [Paracoccus sp. (in: a-proteobacteria)]MDO5612984.1 chemotaxis protein chel [Paracoccus sp. (in: a-proteobacteria)]
MQISPLSVPSAPPHAPAARQLEQAFIENMMQHAFPRPQGGDFGGGAGEDQFASFLAREYAAVLTDSLDLGFSRFIKESSE